MDLDGNVCTSSSRKKGDITAWADQGRKEIFEGVLRHIHSFFSHVTSFRPYTLNLKIAKMHCIT